MFRDLTELHREDHPDKQPRNERAPPMAIEGMSLHEVMSLRRITVVLGGLVATGCLATAPANADEYI